MNRIATKSTCRCCDQMLVLVKAVLPDVYVVGELHELALAAGPTGWRGVWRSLVAQDIGHKTQSLKPRASLLVESLQFTLARLLVLPDMHRRLRTSFRLGLGWLVVVRYPVTPSLVGMQRPRELAVGFVDIILARRGRDAHEAVESLILAFRGLDLVPQAKDLVVFF